MPQEDDKAASFWVSKKDAEMMESEQSFQVNGTL